MWLLFKQISITILTSQLFNCVPNRGFMSCENKVFTFLFTMVLPEQCPWLSLNSPYGSAGIQLWAFVEDSLLVFFSQRMHNCSFIGQILFALLRKFCSIKFNGTNLNKAMLSMLDWKASKLYFSWSHRLKQERKITVIFPTYLFLYLKKQSHILILEYNYISSLNLYTDFQKRANH